MRACYPIPSLLDSAPEKANSKGMVSQRIRRLVDALGDGLLEKEEVLRLTLLAALAGENTFLLGPPGVAKSLLARRVSRAFADASYFEYLLGRFTTPEELFGPVSISRLKDADRFERVVDGFLPTAEIVFLDEIWNASSPILNSLLTAINEHRFRNGSEELHLPLQTVIGAGGGAAPEEPGLDKLWDRFLLRLPVTSVQEADSFVRLIQSAADLDADPVHLKDKITADELDEWSDARDTVTIPPDIAALVLDIRERLARHNSMSDEDSTPVLVSDRRWKHAMQLLRTSALMNERAQVDALDCAILRHCLWSRERDIPVVNTIVEEAIRRYSTSGPFDPDMYRSRLEDQMNRLRSAGTAASEEDVRTPVEYRGEYFRVEDFVDDHLSLIWIGDFQNLTEDEARETDLFFYGDDDDYAYSERFPIRRLAPDTIEIDGQAFELETRTVTRTVEHAVELPSDDLAEARESLLTLRSDVQSVMNSIGDYRERTDTEAEEHLFVHRTYADIIAQGMQEAQSSFALLLTDIEAAISSLEPGTGG